eukprot:gene11053-16987_t
MRRDPEGSEYQEKLKSYTAWASLPMFSTTNMQIPQQTYLKVIYFGLPGRVEPTRLALAIGGIDFENKILTSEWAEMKPKVAPLQLPLLEVDGQMHSQSLAMF